MELIILDSPDIMGLIILFLLIALSAFFSSAETAITTLNKVRIKTLSEEGHKSAKILLKILDSPGKLLSTILIGNNIVNISATSLATILAIRIFGSKSVGIITGILTIFILLFGEIIPKTWATIQSEKISLIYCYPIYALIVLFTPVVFIIDKLSHAFLFLLRIDPNKKASYMTERELKTYVDVSHEDGAIEPEEREMILNVFDFGDSLASDIMIPRIHMTIADVESSHKDILKLFKDSMYSRIPIYEGEKDHIIGVVNVKDFFMNTTKTNFQIQEILRTPYYTYETKKTSDLLIEMRANAYNLAIVLNEYGSCIGMITLEDLLEEIVGEIRDEFDAEEEELIKEIGLRTYLVEASMKIDDINNVLETHLDSEDYDSIGGLMIEELDRIPKEGEEILLENGISLIATKIDQHRIIKVTMILPDNNPDDQDEEYSEDELLADKELEE